MWKIPLFDVAFDDAETAAVADVLASGWLTMGARTTGFEEAMAAYLGCRHAIAVTNCTAALHLAVTALGIGEGDEVICPSLTFVAGANTIMQTGAIPVFADVRSVTDGRIDAADVARRITPRTRAIQVMHYGGRACDMEAFTALAREHDLALIEDAAHAPGGAFEGKPLGTIGDIGCFSFFSNKNMTTGEGGMLATNDDDIAARVRAMRSHGMTTLTLDRHEGRAISYDVTCQGYNYRIDELRAALGTVQLGKLDAANARRRELSALYRAELGNADGIRPMFDAEDAESACHVMAAVLDDAADRMAFIAQMREHGVQTSIHYPPVHAFAAYADHPKTAGTSLPVTEELAARGITLPLYPGMRDEDAVYVCDAARKSLQTVRAA